MLCMRGGRAEKNIPNLLGAQHQTADLGGRLQPDREELSSPAFPSRCGDEMGWYNVCMYSVLLRTEL
jgi:hypothetical protein